MRSGIYTVTAPSGNQYVGSAICFSDRWIAHRSSLRRGVHPNRGLTRAAKKYGIAALVFKKLLVCAPDMLLFYEQRAIDILRPHYNHHPQAGSAFGFKHTEATKEKMAKAHIGKTHVVTEETRRKISNTLTGKSKTAAHTAATRRGLLGQKRSLKERQHMSEVRRALYDGPNGEAIRARISAATKAAIADKRGSNGVKPGTPKGKPPVPPKPPIAVAPSTRKPGLINNRT